ncbi:hypothetical protein IWQ61_006769 [Dispira simplex]|nr:hypothetical protein IWQ61_006769 [Dispira simplex]
MAGVAYLTPNVAQSTSGNTASPSQNLWDNLQALSDAQSLVNVLKNDRYSSIRNALEGNGPYTVLVPSQAALQRVLSDHNDIDDRLAILNYHILSGRITVDDMSNYQVNQTLLNDPDEVNLSKGQNQVVILQRNSDRTTVTSGSPDLSLNVVQADIAASNGVIHILDGILDIPEDINDVGNGISDISSAMNFMDTSEIDDQIDDLNSITAFIPNNAAISNLDFSLYSQDDLRRTLRFHIVRDSVLYSPYIRDTQQLRTLEGGSVIVNRSNDDIIYVNNVRVIRSDILIKNGVIHIIDQVLDPNSAVQGPASSSNNAVAAYSSSLVTTSFLLGSLAVCYISLAM